MLKRILLDDYPTLKPFFQGQTYRLCTYSLPSMIAWSGKGVWTRWALRDGMVILAEENLCHPEMSHLLLPICSQGLPSPEKLARLAREQGNARYASVPEEYVAAVGAEALSAEFILEAAPEYDDYIYRKEDLAVLAGNRYVRKRNLINQFERSYGRGKRIGAGTITPNEVPECLAFLEEWCRERDCGDDHALACEKAAVIRALETIDRLDWQSLYLRLDGRIRAFAITSHLTPDMGVLNFEKADASVKGLYQALDRACARDLFAGYTLINKESDMGIPELAESKRSYAPVAMVRSYTLTLR